MNIYEEIMTQRTLPDNAILIPDNASCVFRGVLFDVYQWQQEMFDGSHGTFEMLRRPDTIAVVAIDDDGKIIACHEEQPGGVLRQNHIIAGRVNAEDATVLAAAKRETEEEVGYRFKNWRLLEVHQPISKMEWFIHAFVAWGEDGKVPVRHDAGEKIIEGRADYLAVRDNNAHWSPKLEEFSSTEELMSYIQSQNT